MKNIWKIFSADARNIRKNVIAMIVVLGLSVVPCLYAWFNIAASWDPYSNTGNLKVAVATEDAGYKGELIPVTLNFGDTILSTLRTNRQLDWRFVRPDRAVEGVKSGDYYAAIVIPESFSRDMMSLFSSHTEKASLRYYLNEKETPSRRKLRTKVPARSAARSIRSSRKLLRRLELIFWIPFPLLRIGETFVPSLPR